MPTEHWERGGSNSTRIFHCPGSVEMAKKYPAEPSSAAAIDGTHTHSVLEHCLRESIADARTLIGTELEDHEGKFEIDKARAERVNVALDYVNARMDTLAKAGSWPALHIERFVDTGKAFDIPRWGGSMDISLTWTDAAGDHIEGIDYKDGAKAVDPRTLQLVTYLAGMRNELNEGRPYAGYIATIIQPKVSAEPLSYRYSHEAFEEKLGPLAEAMALSCDPEAPREAGDHCTFCVGAKPGRCPEWQARAKGALDVLFESPPVPPVMEDTGGTALVEAAPAVPFQFPEIGEETSNETLEQILDAEDIILGLIKEAKAEAIRRAEAGTEFEQWTLGQGRTNRRFAKGAENELKKLRIKKDVYLEEKLKTPKGVLSSDEFKALPETKQQKIMDLIIKPEGKPTLVPKSTAIEDQSDLVAKIPQL